MIPLIRSPIARYAHVPVDGILVSTPQTTGTGTETNTDTGEVKMHVFTRFIAIYIALPGALLAAYALGTASSALL